MIVGRSAESELQFSQIRSALKYHEFNFIWFKCRLYTV